MHPTTVADALCQQLTARGVGVVFGHPGGAILPFYDALHRAGSPRCILVRHEQSGVHAADGYARVTGRPGVCLATSGPGATNLVTGLATAHMDGVPVVAITGQVPTTLMGTDAFQESDILGITLPVTKHGFLLERPEDLGRVLDEAFRIATSGRPGPVLVDIPKDVQLATWTASSVRGEGEAAAVNGTGGRLSASAGWNGAGDGRAADRGEGGDGAYDAALADALALLNAAERPVLMVGRGVLSAGVVEQLRALAERADFPVVTTLLALDAFPADSPRALGMPGMHGSERANRAIQAADVILGLGLRFDDRVTGDVRRFAPGAAIIHADIRPVQIGLTVRPRVRLAGDLRETLPALLDGVRPARRPEWWAMLREWSREAALAADAFTEPVGRLTGRAAARGLARRIAEEGAIVATDVGQHQMLIAQELGAAAPGTHLTSGGLGTMGYSLPAAIGAALAGSDRPVWAVAGDGGFQMCLPELATAVQERLPIRVAVMNNGFLGMVRQWQELFHERRYASTDIFGPDFVALAGAYGVPARAVDRIEALESALDWAASTDGPVLLDLRILREENVFPMVPAGAAIDEMILEPSAEVVR